MNILVANDDGIRAEGINSLVLALSKIANVYVVAPDEQRSGASQSITMSKKMYLEKDQVEGALEAYSFSGTPADCVKMGLELYKHKGIPIDLVFSGINHGGNLGTDTLYSGTLGAAREGLMNGVASVAVSVDGFSDFHFDYACKLAVKAASELYENRKTAGTLLLNINVPNVSEEEIKGVKIAKLGIRVYDDWFNPVPCGDGKIEMSYGGEPTGVEEMASDCDEIADVFAIEEGYATITPLKYDLTDTATLESGILKNYEK